MKLKEKKIIKWMWIISMVPFILIFLLVCLVTCGAFGKLPSFEELENPKSNLATEIISDDGHVIGNFFIQNRSYVQYEDLFARDSINNIKIEGRVMPPIAAALVATEDARFYSHSGIDIPSLYRVGIKTIALGNRSQGGGSTITQQLAKNLFPRNVGSSNFIVRKLTLVVSKLKEWVTAVKLEYNYTKEEIIAMYLNTVEYGSNAYGIKSAASTFFGKLPQDLNLQEAAMLVGVVNAPTRYSPVRNPESALKRRNLVLKRIETAGGISRKECDSIMALPITLNYHPQSHNNGTATYFREMLRLVMTAKAPRRNSYVTEWDYEQAVLEYENNPLYGWCHKNFKADGTEYDIYRDGLKVYTTINASMQLYAEAALQKQLQTVIQPAMDAQIKATGVLFTDASTDDIESIIRRAMKGSDRWRNMRGAGASEKEILDAFKTPQQMKVFTYKGERDTLLSPRDSIIHHKKIMRASIVAIDPHSGHIKAYVGGPDFQYFKYDMAKVGKRQIGSTVKPFIYTFAVDHLGMTPCTTAPNLPVTIETLGGAAWSPKEAGKVEYDGVLHPLKWGLAHSRNNYSAWIMKQAKQPEAVADFIHNMGIKSFIDPVYAMCLGTFESNTFEMVSAYSTFVNEGVYNSPLFVTHIEDRQGNIISTFANTSQEAISKETAYTMLQMLKGVISGGTGGRMIYQFGFRDMDLGGKTGTSNDNKDAWFMCVTPNIVAGAWVGAEDQKVHLRRGGEGSVMALPIVGDFLTRVYNDPTLKINREDKFPVPFGWRESICDMESDEVTPSSKSNDDFFDL